MYNGVVIETCIWKRQVSPTLHKNIVAKQRIRQAILYQNIYTHHSPRSGKGTKNISVIECIWDNWQNIITTLDTQPRKYMTALENIDTSDLMLMIRWVTHVSFRSPKHGWVSQRYKTPYIAKKVQKVNQGTNETLDTRSIWYIQHALIDFSRYFTVCIPRLQAILHYEDTMRRTIMPETKYFFKTTRYHIYLYHTS